MEGPFSKRCTEEPEMKNGQQIEESIQPKKKRHLSADKGVALVLTLILSLAGLVLATGLIYFLVQSIAMSGAGKRYTTASEAADGAVEVMKDAINLVIMGEAVSSLPIVDPNDPACLADSILNEEKSCTTTLTLPGENLFTDWQANVTVTRLYSASIPGSKIEFARSGGAPTTAIYFRINTVVTGPGNARAETSALYRYTL